MTLTMIPPTLPEWPQTDDDGFGALTTESGCLPLTDMQVKADVVGLTASVTVRQTYRNAGLTPVEATYIFPLPNRAAVTSLTAMLGGRKVVGRLDERGQARADYDKAISAGHRAAIVEEERPEIFTCRIGNLQAGETAEIELTLAMQLAVEDGQVTYRFPLVVAPRYTPGIPLDSAGVGDGTQPDTDQVPDASRLSPPVLLPGSPNPVRLKIDLRLDPADLHLSNLRSSLHVLAEGAPVAGATLTSPVAISLKPAERLDRDFIVRWDVAGTDLATSMGYCPDPQGEEGSFCAIVAPPVVTVVPQPRDVVVVLDRSGSMGGWKMVAARRAAGRLIDTLGSADRFGLVVFDDRPETFHVDTRDTSKFMYPATDRNRYRALEYLGRVNQRGGTEMVRALQQGLAGFEGAESNRQQYCVFITDGQVSNEAAVTRLVTEQRGAAKLFVIGIDRSINAGLLQRLAAVGGGHFDQVESEDRLDEVMMAIHRRIAVPILRNVELDLQGAQIVPGSLSPMSHFDCFEGIPLVVRGRYSGKLTKKSVLNIRGMGRDGATLELVAAVKRYANPALGAMWAKNHLQDLNDSYNASRSPAQVIQDRMVQVSLRYQVLCRFTAFVVVDEAEKVTVADHKVIQPVEMPDGWSLGQLGASSYGSVSGQSLGGGLRSASRSMVSSSAPTYKGLNSNRVGGIVRGGDWATSRAGKADTDDNNIQLGGAHTYAVPKKSSYNLPPSAPVVARDKKVPVISIPLDTYILQARLLCSVIEAAEVGAVTADAAALVKMLTTWETLLADLASVGAENTDFGKEVEALVKALRTGAEERVRNAYGHLVAWLAKH